MATVTKMDMIKALVEAGQVEEFKKERDTNLKLASRLFRSLSNEKVKELYAGRIPQSPEEALQDVTEKVKKAAKAKPATKSAKVTKVVPVAEIKIEEPAEIEKAPKAPKAKKKKPEFLPFTDADGNTYKKRWVMDELNARGFGAVTKTGKRILSGKTYKLEYDIHKNVLYAIDKTTKDENGKLVVMRSTLCVCPFIVKAFITKYDIDRK